jgi:hypothetical protein
MNYKVIEALPENLNRGYSTAFNFLIKEPTFLRTHSLLTDSDLQIVETPMRLTNVYFSILLLPHLDRLKDAYRVHFLSESLGDYHIVDM